MQLKAIVCSHFLELISGFISKVKPLGFTSAVSNSAYSLNSYFDEGAWQLILIDDRLPSDELTKCLSLANKKRAKKTSLVVYCSKGEVPSSLPVIKNLLHVFSLDDLISKMDEIMSLPTIRGEAVVSLKNNELFPIDIESIAVSKSVKFDIFVRKGDNQYARIWAQGDKFNYKMLNPLKKDGVKQLFIMRDYLREYMSESVMLSETVASSPLVSSNKKIELLKGNVQSIVRSINTDGINNAVAEHGKMVCKNLTTTVMENKSLDIALESLASLSFNSKSYLYHSFSGSLRC